MNTNSRALQIVRGFYPRVKEVRDAEVGAWVDVSPGDVSGASVKDHKNCPMARACQRTLHMDGAVVSRSTVYLIKGNVATRYRFRGKSVLADEIRAFDRDGKFTPGAYVLHAPEVGNRLGAVLGSSLPSKSKRKFVVHRHEGVRRGLWG